MKLLPVILLISLATLSSSSSLLELSQVLWSRLLGGGYRNVGALDPLRVPVIKVDQSEGDASYRVILRDLEVIGLNGSTIESVNIVRGKLKSNLSDDEAGYVSYNEQRDLDSIRYRFHTLIKEPKPSADDDRQGSASETSETILEYDPLYVRARQEEDLLKAASQNNQRSYYGNEDVERESRRGGFQQQTYNRTYQSNYGDMRVVINSTPRSPASVRVAYSHNYGNAQDENVRPCIGACRPTYAQEYAERTENRRNPADSNNARASYQNQRYSTHRAADSEKSGAYKASGKFGGSGFSAGAGSGQRHGVNGQSQFSVITGIPSADAQPAASSNYEVKTLGNSENYGFNAQYQNKPGIKGGVKGGSEFQGAASNNYEVKSPSNGNYGFSAQYQNQPGVKGGVKGGSQFQGAASDNYEVKTQGNGNYGFSPQYQNQPGVKGGIKGGSEFQGAASSNFEVKSPSYENYGFSAQYQNQPGVKGGVKGVSEFQGAASDNYEVKTQSNGFSAEYQNQPGVKGGIKGGSQFQGAASDNYEVKTQGNAFSALYQNQPGVKGGIKGDTPFQGAASDNYEVKTQGNGFSAQYQNQPGVKGDVKGGINFRSGQLSGESNNGQRPSQFFVQADQVSDAQGSASNNYEVKAQYGGSGVEATNSGVKGGSNSGVNYSANYRNGQLNIQSQGGNDQRFGAGYESNERNSQPSVYFRGSTSHPAPIAGEYNEQERRYQASQGGKFAQYTTSASVEQFEPYKAPMIRLEKQPGYVDVVYARETQQGSDGQSDNLKAAGSSVDPRVYGLEEIMKELDANQRYIIHNFTQGESLNKRNDAARTAVESRRLKDLIRYAKEYQEKQGYFEEGMELIYHFGNQNETFEDRQTNETLNRRKRQHTTDNEEEDVMHVIVRVRVPMLGIRASYGLLGKVGKQPVRGNGLLAGNFTDVIGDFTVELKKVDNKTMIVRAARAKLVAKDRNVKLQGMEEKGPVNEILTQGLMAAEAVAAMIADDLATKALSEGNTDGMIYKMYKNLPVIEKS